MQAAENDYRLEYTIFNSNGAITAQDTLTVKDERNIFAPSSNIPPDSAPITFNAARPENALGFSYKGYEFSTFEGCSVGGFDGKSRDMDCNFNC